MTKLPPHVYYFSGNDSGPCVVLMGGTHGDEKAGVMVIEKLKESLKEERVCGEIYLIIGNPKAVEAGIRFFDRDMNRLFGNEDFGDDCEGKRAYEISLILGKADYLLDIHSTIKPSVPFVYCANSERHLDLAKVFGTQYVVSPSKDLKKTGEGFCSDNFVDRHGGVGITYEGGWQGDESVFDEVYANTKKFLKSLGAAFFGISNAVPVNPTSLKIYSRLIATSGNFRFTKEFNNFDFVKEGEKIAMDGHDTVSAEKDSYIIFPKKDIAANDMACFLASKIQS